MADITSEPQKVPPSLYRGQRFPLCLEKFLEVVEFLLDKFQASFKFLLGCHLVYRYVFSKYPVPRA